MSVDLSSTLPLRASDAVPGYARSDAPLDSHREAGGSIATEARAKFGALLQPPTHHGHTKSVSSMASMPLPPTAAQSSIPAAFYVSVTGAVETAQFPGETMLFCTYTFQCGPDWSVVQGLDTAVSQISKCTDGEVPTFVWNFPVDVTFKSTNPHGWPRLVLTVVSRDMFHRFVVRGYGSTVVPTTAGHHTKLVPTFAPTATSFVQQVSAFFRGTSPQFYDPKFVAKSEGREATRVTSTGSVTCTFNVLLRGLSAHGYVTEAKHTG